MGKSVFHVWYCIIHALLPRYRYLNVYIQKENLFPAFFPSENPIRNAWLFRSSTALVRSRNWLKYSIIPVIYPQQFGGG